MKQKVRVDKNGNIGFVETFDVYRYIGHGKVSMRILVDVPNVVIPEPFVYRAEEFIPISQIHEEMGISKYIRAKKPFYSCFNNSLLLLDMKVHIDDELGKFVKDKSVFKLYMPTSAPYNVPGKGYFMDFSRITATSEILEDLLFKLGEKIVETGYDREAFLLSRMN